MECNLEKYCNNDVSHDFIGKQALTKIYNEGVKQKIRGIIFDGDRCSGIGQPLKVLSKDDKIIGQITSGIYSPKIKKNIGLSMILKNYWEIGEKYLSKILMARKEMGR